MTHKLLMAQYRWVNHTVRLAIQNLSAIEHVVYARTAWHKCLPLERTCSRNCALFRRDLLAQLYELPQTITGRRLL